MTVLFDEGFHALTGFTPFDWQRRFYQSLLNGNPPRECHIPPGMGKSSIIACWLVALSDQVRSGGPVTIPRRLVFAVHRDTVLDEPSEMAYRMARMLTRNFDSAVHGPGAHDCRMNIRKSFIMIASPRACHEPSPLMVKTRLGDQTCESTWKADASRPTIVVDTIDEVGAMLLFGRPSDGRYGRAQAAGLVGQDSLIVHDDAHLAPAFTRMLQQVADLQRRASEPRPFIPVALSSFRRVLTDNAISLELEDETSSVVRSRLDAKKDLILHRVPHSPRRAKQVDRMVELALQHKGKRVKVLVTPTGADDAEAIYAQLKEKAPDATVMLLTERIRGHELRGATEHFNNLDEVRATTYLVCTSTVDVGIDLDVDHLVTTPAPLDVLHGRIGRVNRAGAFGKGRRRSKIEMVWTPRELEPPSKASEVEKATGKTLELLHRWASRGVLRNVGLRPLGGLIDALNAQTLDDCTSPTYEMEDVTDIMVDGWALTSIDHIPGRRGVKDFLRGTQVRGPMTTVAYRSEVRLFDQYSMNDEGITEWFRLYPLERRELFSDTTTKMRSRLGKLLAAHRSRSRRLADASVVVIDEDGNARRVPLEDALSDRNMLSNNTVILPVELHGMVFEGPISQEPVLAPPPPPGHLDVADGSCRNRRFSDESETVFQGFHELGRVCLAPPTDTSDGVYLVAMMSLESLVMSDPDMSGVSQTLEGRAWLTAELAGVAALGLALDTQLTSSLQHAGAVHGLGKERRAWQRWAMKDIEDVPHAQSTAYRTTVGIAGYRHELGALIQASQEPVLDNSPDANLVLHLIASQRGWARPHFEPKAYDLEKFTTKENREAVEDCARRFGILHRQYGAWGLAWLESVMRSADVQASLVEIQ